MPGLLVGLPGIEPGTYGLGNRRSVQLSYNPIDDHESAFDEGFATSLEVLRNIIS